MVVRTSFYASKTLSLYCPGLNSFLGLVAIGNKELLQGNKISSFRLTKEELENYFNGDNNVWKPVNDECIPGILNELIKKVCHIYYDQTVN